jgi:anthranilate phosphoribosyltransferase
MRPSELADLLERLLDGQEREGDQARLAAPMPAPPSAEALYAGAVALRRRVPDLTTLPNRTLIDLCAASPMDPARIDLFVGAGILVAAADGTVAQHGWAPSKAGGAALVHALGLPTQASPQGASAALIQCGYAFLSAGAGGSSRLWALAPASPLLAVLSPLVNPARPQCMLVGVADPAWSEPLARALGMAGVDAALVVSCRGRPGLGLGADSVGHRWSNGRLSTFHHLESGATSDGLESGGATVDAARIESTFDGLRGPLADAIALNAGAALWVAGHLPTFAEARRWARSRLSQRVDIADFAPEIEAISPTSRTSPASASTSRRSPRPPRSAGRQSRDPTG